KDQNNQDCAHGAKSYHASGGGAANAAAPYVFRPIAHTVDPSKCDAPLESASRTSEVRQPPDNQHYRQSRGRDRDFRRRVPMLIQGFTYLFLLHGLLRVRFGFYDHLPCGMKPGLPILAREGRGSGFGSSPSGSGGASGACTGKGGGGIGYGGSCGVPMLLILHVAAH